MAFYLNIKGQNGEKAISLKEHEFDLKIKIDNQSEFDFIFTNYIEKNQLNAQMFDIFHETITTDFNVNIITTKNSFIKHILEHGTIGVVFNSFEMMQKDLQTCFISSDSKEHIEKRCMEYTKDLILANCIKIENDTLYFQEPEPIKNKFYCQLVDGNFDCDHVGEKFEISENQYNTIINRGSSQTRIMSDGVLVLLPTTCDELYSTTTNKEDVFNKIVEKISNNEIKFCCQFVSPDNDFLGNCFEINKKEFELLSKKINSKVETHDNNKTVFIYNDYEDLNGFIEQDRLKEKTIDRMLREKPTTILFENGSSITAINSNEKGVRSKGVFIHKI